MDKKQKIVGSLLLVGIVAFVLYYIVLVPTQEEGKLRACETKFEEKAIELLGTKYQKKIFTNK